MIFRQKEARDDFQLLKKAPAEGFCLCLTMQAKPPLDQISLPPGKTTTKEECFPAARGEYRAHASCSCPRIDSPYKVN